MFETMTRKYTDIQNLVIKLENDKSEHLVEIEKLKHKLWQAEDEIGQIVQENTQMKKRPVIESPGELEIVD